MDQHYRYVSVNHSTDFEFDRFCHKIKTVFLEHARQGYTKIKIFVPARPSNNSLYRYDIRLGEYYDHLNNNGIRMKLVQQLKEEGIEAKIYPSIEESIYDEDMKEYLVKYGGYIIRCKLSDTSQQQCQCLVI